MKKNWFKIENSATDVATCYIYDEISAYGVSVKDFSAVLSGIKAGTINLSINSPGGNVFDGVTIYNLLKEHPAQVDVQVDGLAASIASVIAMAGDKITMAKNAMMMIHNAWSIACGNASDMRQIADVLDKIDGTLVKTYQDRTGCTQRDIKSMMAAETWLNADEALAKGFCDCVGSCADAKASFDLSKFQNAPREAVELYAVRREEPATEREIEALLRDAGVSIAKAKAAIAAIKSEPLRDADDGDIAQALNRLSVMIQLDNLSQSMK